ncbi:hypothetical protein ACWD6I_32075, partial [Streptomyces sp. NPDC002454]
ASSSRFSPTSMSCRPCLSRPTAVLATDEARLPAARAVPQARHPSAPAPAAGRPQPPTARDHPPVDHAPPTKPAVLTALDVPAHELPALTRTPIHDLALSAFTAAQSAAPPAAAGNPRPAPDQGPPPPGR